MRFGFNAKKKLFFQKTFISLRPVNPYMGHFGNVMERHFWTKNPRWIIVSSLADFFETTNLGNKLASFMDKKPEHILVLCPKMTLAEFRKHFFSQIQRKIVRIFCPEMTLAPFTEIGFFVQNSRIRINFEIELGRAEALRMEVWQNLAKSGPPYRPVAFMI